MCLPAGAAAAAALLSICVLGAAASGPAAAASPTPVGGARLGVTGTVVFDGPATAAPPKVAARSYVVADAGSGEVLAAKAPHLKLRPASTIKTLTALTLMPALPAGRTHVGTQADANIEGSKAGVVKGQKYTVRQLWQAVFLRSGNDAVHALVAAGGGEHAVLGRMTATARELGALDTTVANTTGLDAPGQISSAYDLALFGRAAVRRPDLLAYSSSIRSTFPGKVPARGKKQTTFQLWTQQRFVLNYDGAIGVKNGYTTQARYTLIAASTRGGRTVLVTLMGSPRNAWEDAAALSSWAYAKASSVEPVGALVEPGSLAVPAVPATGPPPAQPPAGTPAGIAAAVGTVDDGLPFRALSLGVAAALAVALVALRSRAVLRHRRRREPAAAAANG